MTIHEQEPEKPEGGQHKSQLPSAPDTGPGSESSDLAGGDFSHKPSHRLEQLQTHLLSAAHRRAWNRVENVTRLLLDLQPDRSDAVAAVVNASHPRSGLSLMHYLALYGAPTKLMVRAATLGADLSLTASVTSKKGYSYPDSSALHMATGNGNSSAVEALLELGHEVNSKNKIGDTPLLTHLRMRAQRTSGGEFDGSVVPMLLDRGASVSVRDRNNRVPLHHALTQKDWDTSVALVKSLEEEALFTGSSDLTFEELRSFAIYATLHCPQDRHLVQALSTLASSALPPGSSSADRPIGGWERVLVDLAAAAASATQPEAWEQVRRVLALLEENQLLFDKECCDSMLNERVYHEPPDANYVDLYELGLAEAPEESEPQSAFHLLCIAPAPSDVIERALRVGANTELTTTLNPLSFEARHLFTSLHIASFLAKDDLTSQLVEAGANPNAQNAVGETPLLTHLRTSRDEPSMNIVHALVGADTDLSLPDARGASPLTQITGDPRMKPVFEELKSRGRLPGSLAKDMYEVLIDGDKKEVNYFGLLEVISDLRGGTRSYRDELYDMVVTHPADPTRRARSSPVEYLQAEGHPYDAYLFLKAKQEVESQFGSAEHPFTKLLPALLFRYPPGLAHSLARRFEGKMDSTRRHAYDGERKHENEAELMALLYHPKDLARDSSTIGPFTSALTSVNYYVGAGRQATSSLVHNWARIGVLNFSFLYWRFDAEGTWEAQKDGTRKLLLPSLLQRYGFDFVAGRETDFRVNENTGKREHWFGPGFALTPGSKVHRRMNESTFFDGREGLNAQTYIELRRAYIMVSHPDHGTLTIRNSSPVFGRNRLAHPGYWSSKGIGSEYEIDDVINFNPDLLEQDFTPVVDHRIPSERDSSIDFLLNQFYAVKDDYAAWKFATRPGQAWRENHGASGDELIGGYYSPGFGAVTEYLDQRYRDFHMDELVDKKSRMVLPQMAFVNPHYPPWSPYARMPVTEDVLAVMRKLSVGDEVMQREMEETDLQRFFGEGLKQQAEFVLLASGQNFIR